MKRITLCALLMTLFLLLSCNTSGKNLTDDEVAKSDGTVIDLAKITKNIKDSVAFAKSVTEVHSLVKSIDELAKAIGKKIQNQDTLGTDSGKNTALIAGVFSITLDIVKKSKALQISEFIKDQQNLTQKVSGVTTAAEAFINKLKNKTGELAVDSGATTDDNAQKAIDRNGKPSGENGAKELGDLNTAVDTLLKDAEAAVTSAIKELSTSVKPSN
ncbi:Vsp/OspC family lipoprotein [Borrelia puertoricensis]|uniref:Vsp/OspC family lipoprotein n=1 Tax=Borrelia puertoricensis TaxID=2756107 RepID=UPI001FF39721|nr:Vsp/OspC family lipoprotein [Borrelia puertoricensis]